jgi:hypothetical protein
MASDISHTHTHTHTRLYNKQGEVEKPNASIPPLTLYSLSDSPGAFMLLQEAYK